VGLSSPNWIIFLGMKIPLLLLQFPHISKERRCETRVNLAFAGSQNIPVVDEVYDFEEEL
jgi:hypothetical protein